MLVLAFCRPAPAQASWPESSAVKPAEQALQLARQVASQTEARAAPTDATPPIAAIAGAATSSGESVPAAVPPPRPPTGSPAPLTAGGTEAAGPVTAAAPARYTEPSAGITATGRAGVPTEVSLAVGVNVPIRPVLEIRAADIKRSLLTERGLSGAGEAIERARRNYQQVISGRGPVLTRGQSIPTTAPGNPQASIPAFEWPALEEPVPDANAVPSEPVAGSVPEVRTARVDMPDTVVVQPYLVRPVADQEMAGLTETTSVVRSRRLDTVPRTSHRVSEHAGASARLEVVRVSRSPLPASSGSSAGGGAGATGPAEALLAVALLCMLATVSPRRLKLDPLSWKSTLLSLRLERPG